VDWDFTYLQQLQCRPLSRGRLFATERGRGPVLLFVHGGFHGAWCWSLFLRFFAEHGIPAAALDLRGHGGLPQESNFIAQGVSDMAQDVAEAAAALGDEVVLVGHSLGALICMAASAQIAPRGLILLAPSPPANIPGMRALPPFPPDKAIDPPGEKRARAWFLPGYSGADITPFLERLCPESPALMRDRYALRVSVDPAWMRGPSLCISAGQDDSALHPAGQDEAIAAFYGAAFEMLPDAGHCFMADDSWHAGADLILAWLRHHGLAGAF
jgi:pimeloyl-ACP methyl ester carboxylesterase